MTATRNHALLITEVDEQLSLARQAQAQGKHPQASRYYARAAKALLLLAHGSRDAQLKQQRFDQAMRLRELSNQLGRPDTDGRRTADANQPRTEAVKDKEEIAAEFVPETLDSGINFESVAGLDDVKREIQLRMVLPFAHPEQARHFAVPTGGGLLLYGPPGTGKTLIARATAGELEASFFAIRGSDVVSKWFGEAEKKIQRLFATVRRYERSVLFIDEIDALIPARSTSNSSVMARVVPQFLNEMDGFNQHRHSLLIIGATNEPWALDPAVLRPGRFDVKIHVGLPDSAARRRLIELNLQNRPLADDVDTEELTEVSEGLSGADIAEAIHRAARAAFEASIQGAMDRLDQQRLVQSLKATTASTNQRQLRKYQQWQQNQ